LILIPTPIQTISWVVISLACLAACPHGVCAIDVKPTGFVIGGKKSLHNSMLVIYLVKIG
jgi:hypothetical protein